MYINGILQTGTVLDSERNKAILQKMSQSNSTNTSCLLGNTKATIDVSPGRFTHYYNNEELGVSVFFDGVIYNIDEIKRTLIASNMLYTESNKPSEILAYGFKVYGKDIISMCDGEFIMVFVDIIKDSLIISRDRIGTAPIYYYQNDDTFIFSSSLKNILSSGLVKKK